MVWYFIGSALGVIGAIGSDRFLWFNQSHHIFYWFVGIGFVGFGLTIFGVSYLLIDRVNQYQWFCGKKPAFRNRYIHLLCRNLLNLLGAMALSFALLGISFYSKNQIHDLRDYFLSLIQSEGIELQISPNESNTETNQSFVFMYSNGLTVSYRMSSKLLAQSIKERFGSMQRTSNTSVVKPVWFNVHNSLLGKFQRLSGSGNLDPGGFLAALLLGNRDMLDQRIMVLFRQAGLLHILALSGFHLGLILGVSTRVATWYQHIIPKIAKKGFLPPFWFTRLLEHLGRWLVLCFCIIYCLVAIPGPGLYRAALMAGFMQIQKLLNLRSNFWHGYWLSMIVLLLADPDYITHWGFILSYLALFGLVWAAKPLEGVVKPFLGRFLAWYGSTGIAAVWATIPFFLATTYQAQGLAINGIMVGPLMGWVVTLWAFLGALWLILPLPQIDNILSSLGQATYVLLLQGRLVPALSIPPLVLLSIWVLVGVLIGVYQYWYSGSNDNRLRLSSVSAQFPGTPGIFYEKAIWPKLHDQSESSRKNCFLSNRTTGSTEPPK
jgi:ComEC/Rec2-related protein